MIVPMLVAATLLFPQAPTNQFDLSTPKGAARSLYDAVARGDEVALAEHFFAADASQRDLVSAYAHLVIQGKRLGDVAKQKFAGATDALAQGVLSADDLAKLDEATIQEQGDSATIRFTGKSKELLFRRASGRWRLVITDRAIASEQDLAEQAALVREFAKAMSDTADEIAADKYSTPQDAESALQTKVNIVLTKTGKTLTPTTGATAPSTQPG